MSTQLRTIRSGAAMVIALVALLVVSLIAGTLLRSMLLLHRQSRSYQRQLQAGWLADSAVQRAAAQLASNREFSGETWTIDLGEQAGRGVAVIQVEAVEDQPTHRMINIEARYPDDPVQRSLTTRNVTLIIPGTGDSP